MPRIAFFGIAILILAAGLWFALNRPAPEISGTPNNIQLGGPFNLIDHDGRPVTEKDFQGRYQLVFFGYTFCPDVCPTALQTVSETFELMGSAGEMVSAIFVSVDPRRDTPAVLKDYVGNFHDRIVGLTGDKAEIAKAAKAYRAYYKLHDTEDQEDYMVDHTAILYLLGPDGKYLRHFAHGVSAEDIAAGLRKHL